MKASRPILIFGAGIHLAHAEKEAIEYAERNRIPVCATWGGLDILPSAHPLSVGSFGTHGTRAGNFAVQNATHITAIGTRLDSKATGTPIESFARGAYVFILDIDEREIRKFDHIKRIIGTPMDAKRYFQRNVESYHEPASKEWLDQINLWKTKYQSQGVQYDLIRKISEETPEDTIVCTDTGCAVAWVSQAWQWKKGQRFIHAFNQTPMGYGLPAALGAWYATGKNIVLISGDGSLMMSLGELATIKGLPIKIHLLDNKGHAMCRQTEREWLDGKYCATGIKDLKFPDWYAVRSAFGVDMEIHELPEDADVVPKVKYGHANEDGHPLIDISKEMLIPLWTAS